MSKLPKIDDTGQYDQVFQAVIPGISHKASFGIASIVSPQFAETTTVVRLTPTENCWIKFGNSLATAAAINDGSSTFLQGGVITILGVPDQCDRIAVIRDTDDGDLHVVEAL